MRTLYFCPVVSSIFFYILLSSLPNLSRRRLDVYHTSTHGEALVRIQDAGMKRAARGSLKIQDAKNRQKFAIWAPSHNSVGLYLGKEGMYGQSEKNLLSSNISSRRPRNMANFGPLTAEIGSGVCSTPANFNGFSSCLCYCSDVAHRRPTKLCTMFGCLLGWYTMHTFSGAVALWRNVVRCKIYFTSNSCVLLYWQRYCTALQQRASAKLCGVVQGM